MCPKRLLTMFVYLVVISGTDLSLCQFVACRERVIDQVETFSVNLLRGDGRVRYYHQNSYRFLEEVFEGHKGLTQKAVHRNGKRPQNVER
uniref:KTSC domain-containing protein n=1 Tax=Steinernema glaseri TaxID=37863 RepID=A0A1I8A7K9_9BILA